MTVIFCVESDVCLLYGANGPSGDSPRPLPPKQLSFPWLGFHTRETGMRFAVIFFFVQPADNRALSNNIGYPIKTTSAGGLIRI